MMAADVDLRADIIDVRDLIERFKEIEDSEDEEETEERDTLSGILDDLKGQGGDEQWRGDWYPTDLIRDSYFEDYARELAEDIGAIKGAESWPLSYIDWEAAANALRMDYTPTEIEGTTYWYR